MPFADAKMLANGVGRTLVIECQSATAHFQRGDDQLR
jgi:hypothetical protein